MLSDIVRLNSALLGADLNLSEGAREFIQECSQEDLNLLAASGYVLLKPSKISANEDAGCDASWAYSALARMMAASDLPSMVCSFCLARDQASLFASKHSTYQPSGVWELTFPQKALRTAIALGAEQAIRGHLSLARAT